MHLQYLYSPPLLPQHLAIFAIWPSQSTTLYFYSDHHRGQVCRRGCPRRIPKEFRSKGCFKLLVSPCVVPRGFPLAFLGGSACSETKRCDTPPPCFSARRKSLDLVILRCSQNAGFRLVFGRFRRFRGRSFFHAGKTWGNFSRMSADTSYISPLGWAEIESSKQRA